MHILPIAVSLAVLNLSKLPSLWLSDIPRRGITLIRFFAYSFNRSTPPQIAGSHPLPPLTPT